LLRYLITDCELLIWLQITLLDIANKNKIRAIQKVKLTGMDAPVAGPHVIKIDEKQGLMAVGTYFVDVPGE
jgi:hypothetical protein